MPRPEPACRAWRKSSWSGNGQDCVEVAETSTASRETSDHSYEVRDSKDPNGPRLLFTRSEWQSFIKSIKSSRYDRFSQPSDL